MTHEEPDDRMTDQELDASIKGGLIVLTLAACLLGAFLLAGCATWSHPYKDETAFQMDWYTCELSVAPAQDPLRIVLLRSQCMKLKGWREG